MSINLYAIYIKAWSDYAEDKVMNMLQQYFRPYLKNMDGWYDIKFFHDNFSIRDGDYYGVDSNYAIGDNLGNVVWEGSYPTEEVIKQVVNSL